MQVVVPPAALYTHPGIPRPKNLIASQIPFPQSPREPFTKRTHFSSQPKQNDTTYITLPRSRQPRRPHFPSRPRQPAQPELLPTPRVRSVDLFTYPYAFISIRDLPSS